MRHSAPFQPDDLAALNRRLLCSATAVVPMREVADGTTDSGMIGLRHDCDNVIEPAVAFAEWEADHGYTATYFVLHTAPYWQNESRLRGSLERIAALGHEIGIHNNAVAEASETGGDPVEILAAATDQLRGWGFEIRGTVAHGDPRCYTNGTVRFVNDELFSECARPGFGFASRPAGRGHIEPVPLATFGLEYDANWLPRAEYLSDSGGAWSRPFDEVADGFPFPGQLHMLVHPDWWGEAFVTEAVAV
jgi:hypothetical protein